MQPATKLVDETTAPAPEDGLSARALLGAGTAVLVGAVAVSWWVNRPTGPGAVLTALGQLAGFGSALFALVTVALMARIPAVTDLLGSDWTVRWHRRAATATVVLLAAHVVAVVLGYAAADRASVLHEIASLVTTYPWMLCATVGTALLVAISASSVQRARRRLRYDSWLFGHWYSYLAVGLAFGHEVTDGASFVHASAPTLLWTWLHLVVACAVGWYRVAVPAWRMATHPLRVDDVRHEGPKAVSITLSGRHLDDYAARAGQHLRIRFVTRAGWWQSHPFSLSAAPTPTRWRITVVAGGDYTDAVQTLVRGTRALVSGAYGHLTAERRRTDRVVLIGGGTGITPLRALLEVLPIHVDTRVVYRARRASDVVLKEELDALAARRGTHIDYLVGARPADRRRDPLSPHGLRHLVPDLPVRHAYVCGRSGFVETVCASLRANNVSPDCIHTERFDA